MSMYLALFQDHLTWLNHNVCVQSAWHMNPLLPWANDSSWDVLSMLCTPRWSHMSLSLITHASEPSHSVCDAVWTLNLCTMMKTHLKKLIVGAGQRWSLVFWVLHTNCVCVSMQGLVTKYVKLWNRCRTIYVQSLRSAAGSAADHMAWHDSPVSPGHQRSDLALPQSVVGGCYGTGL